MDLVDLIEEKKFLGQEFLTWLWYKSEERGGTIFLPESGTDIEIIFAKHMLLEFGEGEAHERLVCKGLQTELKEARTGLLMGKKLEQARIQLVHNDYEFHLTLRGALMEFQSVRLPKTIDGVDESDDHDAVAGRLLEHAGLYETAVLLIDDLFRIFLAIRISTDWHHELTKIRSWIHKSALKN